MATRLVKLWLRPFRAALIALLMIVGLTTASVTLTATPASAFTYATSARWIDGPYGATLSIIPSGIAQAIGLSAASGIWNNALSMVPFRPYSTSVYNSMFEQLQCHLLVRLKTPYNLDTWRPNVSWGTEISRHCNPLPGEHN